MSTLERDPYAEGLDAAHSGSSGATCPYSYDSADGELWLQGFEAGGGDCYD